MAWVKIGTLTYNKYRQYTQVMIVMVEIIQDKAFHLLSDMERLDLIRLNVPVKNTDNNNAEASEKKLSDRFAGALLLTDDRYSEFQNTLREGRNEWNRDICNSAIF